MVGGRSAGVELAVEASAIDAEIDLLDDGIIELYRRRAALSRRADELRVAAGGTRRVLRREQEVVGRYRQALGRGGCDLATVLLNAAGH